VRKELTPNEKLMDTNNDGRVSKKERRDFKKPGGAGEREMQSKFGLSYALLSRLAESEDPEARAFYQWFQGKTREYINNPTGFSDRAFQIDMDSQPWAQRYKSTAIQDMDFEARFPDLYRDEINSRVESLRDQAASFGASMTEDQLRELAVRGRRFNMSESELANALTDYVAFDSGNIKGSARVAQNNIKSWAMRNGLQLSDNMVNEYTKNILAGNTTEADVLQDLRNTYLVGAFPAWSDRIQAGMDPADIAAPYKQRMARLLEVGEDEIDLNDALLQRGMQGVGADGKPSVTPLYAFDREIRNDDRWQYTQNAMDTYAKAGTKILQMFGLR
jgi:hypothetical protein